METLRKSYIEDTFKTEVNLLLKTGTFNFDTMRGSQGELSKVDIRMPNNDIYRIVVFDDMVEQYDVVKLQVLRYKNAAKATLLWTKDGELMRQYIFYKIAENAYTIKADEAKAFKDITSARRNNYFTFAKTSVTSVGIANALISIMRKERGYKNIADKNIKCIEKLTKRNTYLVTFNNGKEDFYFRVK